MTATATPTPWRRASALAEEVSALVGDKIFPVVGPDGVSFAIMLAGSMMPLTEDEVIEMGLETLFLRDAVIADPESFTYETRVEFNVFTEADEAEWAEQARIEQEAERHADIAFARDREERAERGTWFGAGTDHEEAW